MGENTTSRREFLRNALGVVVIASTSPLVVLGRVTPELAGDGAGGLIATYTIKLSDYKDLATVGGSIRLTRPEQLLLNPDHVDNAFEEDDFPIAITRTAESGADAFKAVSTYCTHGFGYQIGDYNRSTGQFVCPHKGSTFRADGTHVQKSGTPDVGDLRKFPVVYDAEAGTLTLQEVRQISGIKTLDVIPARLFLDQNYPNPFNPSTMVRYGLPSAASVRLSIHSLVGGEIKVVLDTYQDAGVYMLDVQAQDLPSGIYFYRLQTTLGTLTRRMTVSK